MRSSQKFLRMERLNAQDSCLHGYSIWQVHVGGPTPFLWVGSLARPNISGARNRWVFLSGLPTWKWAKLDQCNDLNLGIIPGWKQVEVSKGWGSGLWGNYLYKLPEWLSVACNWLVHRKFGEWIPAQWNNRQTELLLISLSTRLHKNHALHLTHLFSHSSLCVPKVSSFSNSDLWIRFRWILGDKPVCFRWQK